MKIAYKFLILTAIVFFTNAVYGKETNAKDFPYAEIYSITDASYKEVIEEFLFAVENKGMVISYRSHVHDMLARTSKDLGYKTNVYKHADIFGFCKSNLSQMSLHNNPHLITFCPYAVSIYQPVDSKSIYLSYRNFPKNLPANSVLHKVKKLLHDLIVETGAEKI